MPGAVQDLERGAAAREARHQLADARSAKANSPSLQQLQGLERGRACAEDLSQHSATPSSWVFPASQLDLLEPGATRLQHGGQGTKHRLEKADRTDPETEGLERRRDEGEEGRPLAAVAHQLEASQVLEPPQVLQQRHVLGLLDRHLHHLEEPRHATR
jgi:hypothetical protein